MYRVLFIFSALLILPFSTQAETVVRAADIVTVSVDQRVASDFYALGTDIVQSGTVVGDMYAIGGTVTANGPIEADVTAIAGRVVIDDTIGDDVRAIAGEVRIAGAVAGDVFVIAGTVHILPTASIAGDVYVFGGSVEVAGPVGGSVLGRMERVRVDAAVAGSVDVVARQGLTLGARAEIGEDVRYRGSRTLVRAPEAIIGGTVTSQGLPMVEDDVTLVDQLLPLLVMLFGSLVLYLVSRQLMGDVVLQAYTKPLRSSLVGFGVYVAGLVLALALLATILGLVIGLGMLGVYIIVVALSYSIAPMILGVLLWRVFGGATTLQPFAILLGVCVLQIALLLPLVGGLLLFSLSVLAAGALAEVVVHRIAQR